MQIKYLGLLPYSDTLGIMESIHTDIVNNPSQEGIILVVQHPPTVTMGKRELYTDMLIPPEQLKYKGVAFHKIDRGGSVTVHEPGQIVIYPIFQIQEYQQTVRSYVHLLEEAMIETAALYGVNVQRDEINPGVWVGQNKIGAIGIRIKDKVTKHGIAFNVLNSLETFSNIIPCGLHGRGVINLLQAIKDIPIEKRKIPLLDYHDVERYLAQTINNKLSLIN
ncbi:lipoyl(octanoyl) transferase LipB [Pigmentibacter sp. JX0631]|uniref:lipoyl(octanoyl) transferase LipB n=1 Tax=Pigmentibacter sp. JX0631 TaxID=2976982 RepID=UPI0024696535|nr:lipoyl(octanoyl) transferase LipB [Pigmentibacter sp. JX0631]WGL59377.1 lipoyl(octanoyl) transferase LipB [Pigmentibacter sp. JX0631]